MEKWQIYVREARAQAQFARRAYAAYVQAAAANQVLDIFYHLHHFIVHAISIDRILDAAPGSDRRELLEAHIDLSRIDLKPFRRLRNHLEHFDERLDRWIRNYDGDAFFDMNIVTGCRGFPEKAFLRALDGDTFRFHGEAYSMAKLHEAVVDVERQLDELPERGA